MSGNHFISLRGAILLVTVCIGLWLLYDWLKAEAPWAALLLYVAGHTVMLSGLGFFAYVAWSRAREAYRERRFLWLMVFVYGAAMFSAALVGGIIQLLAELFAPS
jgi:hypothetical protein